MCRELSNKIAPANVIRPEVKDITADLKSLVVEFPSVKFDRHATMLSVTTENMVLEDEDNEDEFDFGKFEIRLDLRAVTTGRSDQPYEIHSIDRRANYSGGYYHPHVTGHGLCVGDGGPAILTALRQGRFLDFFTIVNQILATYNPDSPYAELSSWLRSEPEYSCASCEDDIHDPDDVHRCDVCDETYCGECASYCDAVGVSICTNCMDEGSCASGCDYAGTIRCATHTNPQCAECGTAPSDDDMVGCEHAHRSNSYASSGYRNACLCRPCYSRLRDTDARRCELTRISSGTGTGGRDETLTEPCQHYGTDSCAFVIEGDVEEGELPESEREAQEAAGAEAEVATEGTVADE